MNKYLDEAIFDIAKVDALMFSIEKTYLDFEVIPEERARMDQRIYAFYALWDAIHKVGDDLEMLAVNCKIVDTICAVNGIQRNEGTLKPEK